MKQNSILEIMVSHHALIEVYFSIAKDDSKRSGEVAEWSFNNFKWQLEKHFFVEGHAILESYSLKNEKAKKFIKQIMKEHKEMIIMAEKIQENLSNGKTADFSDLEKLLTSHRNLEERELYPLLDKELTLPQKEVVVKRINEIVLEKK